MLDDFIMNESYDAYDTEYEEQLTIWDLLNEEADDLKS
jgi:hypothetical protein